MGGTCNASGTVCPCTPMSMNACISPLFTYCQWCPQANNNAGQCVATGQCS
jgi:hypothetical protein